MKRNELLIHPVRSQIIGAVSGRALTTAQIAKVLPDVPLPSLYRHVRVLAEAGIIVAAEERKVRGAVERAYTLAEGGGRLDPSAPMTPEENLGALTNFTSLLGHAYRSYLDAGGKEPPIANMAALYLNQAEEVALRDAIRAALEPMLANPAGEGRRRRVIAFVNLPDFEPTPEP